jgi:hypothetical protein
MNLYHGILWMGREYFVLAETEEMARNMIRDRITQELGSKPTVLEVVHEMELECFSGEQPCLMEVDSA